MNPFPPSFVGLRSLWSAGAFCALALFQPTGAAGITTKTPMKVTKTSRGFELIHFKDRNGIECSLQESSLATERALWLGCQNANPRVLVPGQSWQPIPMPAEYIADTRMHLNEKQVKALVAHLNRWLKAGTFKGA
jgi:hypothetical protein